METKVIDTYDVHRIVEDGIERISYLPKQRCFETPILMQHGMWHGAWCWRPWQELFAEWGWESHAFSLPGHAGSLRQRPVYFCTLDYYLRFLKAEVERLPCKPVLMGHSMGGALTQWYLKHVGDDLPAAVLVAPWASHNTTDVQERRRWLHLDPLGLLLAVFTGSTRPLIRNPKVAAKKLISAKAIITPEELHAQLSPESLWVMIQHNPPFWYPPTQVKTPLLWLVGDKDAVIGVEIERKSAVYYQADFSVIADAGHNLMLEHNYRETAQTIHNWLGEREIM